MLWSWIESENRQQLIAQVPPVTFGKTQKPLFHLHRERKATIFSWSVFRCALIKGLINLKWINSVNTWELFCSESCSTSKEFFVTLNYSLNRWLMRLSLSWQWFLAALAASLRGSISSTAGIPENLGWTQTYWTLLPLLLAFKVFKINSQSAM